MTAAVLPSSSCALLPIPTKEHSPSCSRGGGENKSSKGAQHDCQQKFHPLPVMGFTISSESMKETEAEMPRGKSSRGTAPPLNAGAFKLGEEGFVLTAAVSCLVASAAFSGLGKIVRGIVRNRKINPGTGVYPSITQNRRTPRAPQQIFAALEVCRGVRIACQSVRVDEPLPVPQPSLSSGIFPT